MTQFAAILNNVKAECNNVFHQKSVVENILDDLNLLSQFQSLSPTKAGFVINESLHNQSKSNLMRRKCNITELLPPCRFKSPSNTHTHRQGSKCPYYGSSSEVTTVERFLKCRSG